MLNKKIDNQAHQLLIEILNEDDNNERVGILVNQLNDLIYQGASWKILETYYEKASNWGDYRNIGFLIDEGPFFNDKNISPLIKKLLNTEDSYVISEILVTYVSNITTIEELRYLLSLCGIGITSKLCGLEVVAMKAIVTLSKEQLVLLKKISFKEDKEPLHLFFKSKNELSQDFLKKNIFNKSEIYKKIVFMVAVYTNCTNEELKELVKLSKSVNIYDFYYIYCN